MSRLYAQAAPTVFIMSGSMAANASTSGSLASQGYAKLVGAFRSDVALQTGSGIHIQQSFDYGTTYDLTNASNSLGASTLTACSVDIIGNAVQVTIRNGATAASAIRGLFYLRPV